jgi:hypothetical protein
LFLCTLTRRESSLEKSRIPQVSQTKALVATNNAAEWATLLECAAARPDSRRLAELLRQVSWPALLLAAENHGVIPLLSSALLAHGLESSPPRDVASRLHEMQRERTLSSLKLNGELFRLTKLLQDVPLDFAAVKGPTLAVRAYGDAGAREYGDLDFVVRHRNVLQVHELMGAAGYQSEVSPEAVRTGKIPGQYQFVKALDHILVEFHTERTMRYFPRGLPIEDFLARRESVAIDGHSVPALAIEDELVLICIHGSKHLWDRLSFVVDVSGLLVQRKDLNLEKCFATARRIGAERMLSTGLLLARDLLRTPLPAAISNKLAAEKRVVELAEQIARRLPSAGAESAGLFSRARYRVTMSGGGLKGLAHLARLTLSPTQEDWVAEPIDGNPRLSTPSDADWASEGPGLAPARRIARLAKKYRRTKKPQT